MLHTESIGWILSLIGLVGAMANIKKMPSCFIIWSIGNCGWMVLSIWVPSIRPQIPLWIGFTLLNIWGYRTWKRKGGKNGRREEEGRRSDS